ncbi:hypothetical protein M9Y10_006627 [Tritrichomonas musculus]|uniref:Uncharacterized protein n=1 Tax=Tritrichomonas musculus TaxID=1915356 RepID=A0ABR2JF70_9EUKA
MDDDEKRCLLEHGSENNMWGGFRENKQKISYDSIECLIVLVLDFPTMSAKSYANYLNSQFGPKHTKGKYIHTKNVQSYLKNLDFSVKNCSFEPTHKNCVGLRIYRVAWCRFIKDIINNDNVLLSFIDEADIT